MKQLYARAGQSLSRGLTLLLSALLVGLAAGLAGTLFHYAVDLAAEARRGAPWLVLFLPAAGLVIVYLYSACKVPLSMGTDAVLEAAYNGKSVPLPLAPLIFISTVITHLYGGSAGREGAALQLGGTLALSLGRLLPALLRERSTLILSGMSALFAALFGTPLAASVFVLEVGRVGSFRSPALLSCVLSSLAAGLVARALGVPPALIALPSPLPFAPAPALLAAAMAVAFALVSRLFVAAMHAAHRGLERLSPNPYTRIALGGAAVALITFALGTQDYNGAGMPAILSALRCDAVPYAFLLKMGLTALTLGAGFRGGEIVPAFFVGATFGCTLGGLIGLEPASCAAMGLVAVFAGVTKAPLAAVLLGAEMFGLPLLPYFGLAAAVSFALSGTRSLYHSQTREQFAE